MKNKSLINQSPSKTNKNNEPTIKNEQKPVSFIEIDLCKSEEKTYSFKSFLFPMKSKETIEKRQIIDKSSPPSESKQSTAQTSRNKNSKAPLMVPHHTSYFSVDIITPSNITQKLKVNAQTIATIFANKKLFEKKEVLKPKIVTNHKKNIKSMIIAVDITSIKKQNSKFSLKIHNKNKSLNLVNNNIILKQKV